MATVTLLFAFYFFFASFIAIFKYLKWQKGFHTTGVAVGVSEPEQAYSFLSGQQEMYTFDMQVQDGDIVIPCKYVEKKGKKQEHKLELNTTVHVVLDRSSSIVIMREEYNDLKKNLYRNPLFCVGCIAATIILMVIASSI